MPPVPPPPSQVAGPRRGGLAIGRLVGRLCRPLCNDLTSKVESVLGDAVGMTDKAGLSSVLANPAVSQVLATAPANGLLTTVDNATAVPDYCGLLLALPTVPVPGDFTQLPASILNQTRAGCRPPTWPAC